MKLPLGFRYAATYAGIRKVAKPDLALIVADSPAAAAAVFTTNRVQAAPVILSREHLVESHGVARAVMVNAGNANCATRTGRKVASKTSGALAKLLNTRVEYVLPSSTGVIGVELDPNLITKALPALVDSLNAAAFDEVADAILTTDTVRKTAFAETNGIRIAGMTKGAGMIHPGMATTLAYVMTDAAIPAETLRAALKRVADVSYNRLSVDGDMSTNDTLLVLASGASGVTVTPKLRAAFEVKLTEVCQSLAKQIARDGEGAKRLIEIRVEGAKDVATADAIGRAIANSPLVKTAIAGCDPNWGRILCAAGYSGGVFDPATVDIELQGVRVCRKGLAAPFQEDSLTKKLHAGEVTIRFVIGGTGKSAATFWTCDLTEGYIEINGSYRT